MIYQDMERLINKKRRENVNIEYDKKTGYLFNTSEDIIDEMLNGVDLNSLADNMKISISGLLDIILGWKFATEKDMEKIVEYYAEKNDKLIKNGDEIIGVEDSVYDHLFSEVVVGKGAKFASLDKYVHESMCKNDRYIVTDKNGLIGNKTVVELASRIGVSRSYVSLVLNGRNCVSGEIVSKLLAVCGKDFNDKFKYFEHDEEDGGTIVELG